jgi:uncharacterized membrane protein/mono/diheme cytochrome c family protein
MLPLAEIAFLAPSGAAPMLAESGPDLSRALGRLHPLMVHFPIALALVAICAEWWRSLARQQGLSALTRPLLWIAALSAVFATTSGWVNAAHEHAGSDSATLNLHRWIGTGTTVFLVLLAVWSSAVQAMIARASSEAVAQLGAFRWVALMGGVAVGVTGHLGGELVHGEGYLSKVLLPAAEKRELEPKTEAPVQEIALSPDETFFLEKVRPILEVHCFECHGARKQKGGLRMDTKAWLFGPDESKWTVVPGIPEESDLLQRVLLERDDPDAMPPEGSGLTADEITVLRTWIEKGAAFPERAASGVPGLNVSAASTALATLGTVAIAGGSTVEIPEDVRKRGMEAARSLAARGVLVQPIAQESVLVDVNASRAEPPLGDADAPLLADLAPMIANLNLSQSALTDAGLSRIGPMIHLERLRLDQTAIGDEGVKALGQLGRLESVNLIATKVSPSLVAWLRQQPALRRVYVWQTALDTPELLREMRDGGRIDPIGADLPSAQPITPPMPLDPAADASGAAAKPGN